MELVYKELTRLVDDLYKCEDLIIKRKILMDIDFLRESLNVSEFPFWSAREGSMLLNPSDLNMNNRKDNETTFIC